MLIKKEVRSTTVVDMTPDVVGFRLSGLGYTAALHFSAICVSRITYNDAPGMPTNITFRLA